MLPFDFLGISFSNNLLFRWQMAFISAPIIRIESRDPEWLQESPQFQKYGIFAITEHISEDFSSAMVDRVPEPALMLFVADITPHFIEFSIINTLNFNRNIARLQTSQNLSVDRFKARFFFLIR